MEDKLISVIVPVYNTAPYLEKCMDSILGQDYHSIEVICINDGSTDKSAEILADYQKKDERVKIISQQNGGLSAARNSGLKAAAGDYILFLDSDDWLESQTCSIALKTAEEASADIVMWSYVREYPEGSKLAYIFDNETLTWDEKNIDELRRRLVGLTDEELRRPQTIDSAVTAWGKLYKRSVVSNTRFVDTEIIGSEDVFFNINVFHNACRVIYIPTAYSHYRKDNPNSLTHSYKSKLVCRWKRLYEMIEDQLKHENAPEKYYEALSNRICLGLIGLGLNLAEDNSMSFSEKRKELKKILNMSHYRRALGRLQLKYFPIHWKLFFGLAKYKFISGLHMLLVLMNRLRA